ncbi:hypothetical protein [Legionella feeleii]|uniref:Uncharacterized protein n=1 Tax=Legionella feeleii TaxID=453 RepID=A0A0W0U8Y1_9GAMM|nr:hypothetical protein [Legionella feeleii]KTD04141.1 hypothetical protein Lfee_0229 [Legionella feeleii]SPX60748.1 Uncharacterised protein [Legionella feeleii]
MKRLLVATGLLFASTGLFADCSEMGISIQNDSDHNCILKNHIIYYGYFSEGSIPTTIPAKTSTGFFYGSQDSVGVGIILAYTCGNETVKFYSGQNYCSFWTGAGDIGGMPYDSSTLSLSYTKTPGSALANYPGHIVWRIS